MISNRFKWALLGLVLFFFMTSLSASVRADSGKKTKVYWFIPDGFRADRKEFNIYYWAKSGELPNLKKMMDEGCRGYSRPTFPGHTPVNFATLMTGVSPIVHGVADGTMRLEGSPLNRVLTSGFSSFAKWVEPIWVQLEKMGSLVTLQSIPGSTPPELSRGNTIKGRWGAWGVDVPAIIFQDKQNEKLMIEMGQNKKLFSMGSDLTRFTESANSHDWKISLPKNTQNSNSFEVNLSNRGYSLYGIVTKGSNGDYDQIRLSHDKSSTLVDLKVGQWSEWLPVTLDNRIETFMKIKMIRLGSRGEFRLRIIYDGLNSLTTSPSIIADKMRSEVGHMVDYVDSYPPQLIYFPEDKTTFLEESNLSWDWHLKAVPFLAKSLDSDVVIQSIYSPNQMLTSRWWLPFLDKESRRYQEKSDSDRSVLWSEVKAMYKKADDVLGEILKDTDSNWYVVLSSDHGVIPLYREVRLNNLFYRKGWLKYKFNPLTQENEINWDKTQVIYLQMNNIYINPTGLGGLYKRANSAEYTKLRSEVQNLLENLTDPDTGVKVTSHIWTHEKALDAGLPESRVGDLIISNAAQYLWSEDISEKKEVFVGTLKGGYKQGVWPKDIEGMLTPFVIMGPGIKKGCEIKEPIQHIDQYATLARILGLHPPYKAEGRVLEEIFK